MAAPNAAMVYIVTIFMIYVMITVILFILFRRPLIDEFRLKFLVKRGYGYVEISGNDRRVREYFLNLKKKSVKVDDCVYFIDPKKARAKNKAGYYEFKQGISEPIDLYDQKLVGTDAEYLDGFMLKCKSLAKVAAAKETQMILYATMAAAIMATIAAVLAYTDYQTLQEIATKLLK